MMPLGKYIKHLCDVTWKIKLYQLAEKTGFSRDYLSTMVHRNQGSTRLLKKIEEVMGMEPGSLVMYKIDYMIDSYCKKEGISRDDYMIWANAAPARFRNDTAGARPSQDREQSFDAEDSGHGRERARRHKVSKGRMIRNIMSTAANKVLPFRAVKAAPFFAAQAE